jgi:hypothetical protein
VSAAQPERSWLSIDALGFQRAGMQVYTNSPAIARVVFEPLAAIDQCGALLGHISAPFQGCLFHTRPCPRAASAFGGLALEFRREAPRQ